MNLVGEAAVDLPWLAPCASSLVTLARPAAAPVWPKIRHDPGCVLLFARAAARCSTIADKPIASLAREPILLETILSLMYEFDRMNAVTTSACSDRIHAVEKPVSDTGFVDWSQPAPQSIYRVCLRQAQVAHEIAVKTRCCDPERAWLGGLVGPLGWLAVCAVEPTLGMTGLYDPNAPNEAGIWQQKRWGMDQIAIARRLARQWRLPAWLCAIIGQLGLPVSTAQRLGAEPGSFQAVQLAVALVQRQQNGGLGLQVGATIENLVDSLGISAEDLGKLQAACGLAPDVQPQAAGHWQPPSSQPLLVELLELALENRRNNDAVFIETLQREIDALQQMLTDQATEEGDRLNQRKLSALAEFAAGAGHEINNPLAVISGQAQYVLKHMQQIQEELTEETSAVHVLEILNEKVGRSIEKIVGQSHRIHHVLTDLMQFAKPSLPKRQTVPISELVSDVLASLEDVALNRRIRLEREEIPADWALFVDPQQARTALSGLVRNAIEAAPADGWTAVRIARDGPSMRFLVEDSGPGLPAAAREHLFDPFFSGRNAGRGRGLGLSVAWRLARVNGGDVQLESPRNGPTRFVLTLPALDRATTNGQHHAKTDVKLAATSA